MKEATRCSTIQLSGKIEVLHARYFEHSFAPHWHDEFAVGLIDAGVERFRCGGREHHAATGEVILVNAGQVHTGEGLDERGFGFRMLYIPESTFREVASALQIQSGSLFFSEHVVRDVLLRQALLATHRAIAVGGTSLEKESLLLSTIRNVVERYSSWSLLSEQVGVPSSIERAREYLHDHICEDVSLENLANAAGLSKFHLLRSFRRSFGLPPHAYQLQQRILRAKQMLPILSPAEVAHDCGFTDQSHLNRVFRAFIGTTPGRYAQQFHPIRSQSRRSSLG